MSVLKGLKPEKVFAYFEKLCAVPHGSGNTQISATCVCPWPKSWASSAGRRNAATW